MGKFALLIGVSEYKEGLSELPAATKDTVALQKVLEDPRLGDFDDVQLLSNPDSGEIIRTVDRWLSEREATDLVLLFFSGHGLKDDRRKLYFAAGDTQKDLVRSTAVSASVLHEFFLSSKPRKQVIILDCCFSGAFGDLVPRDDGELALQEQLEAKGRVVLTSTNAVGYAFEEKEQEAELSIYTRYLVEGIKNGTTVESSHRFTTVRELHKFVSRKVKAAAPAMSPGIIVGGQSEGYDIQLARRPQEKPHLKYRKAVEKRVRGRGNLTSISRRMLNDLQRKLLLSEEEATAIEADVLQPFREYERKRTEYREALMECLEVEPFLNRHHIIDLKDYQKYLGLKDKDVRLIEKELAGKPLTFAKESCVLVVSSQVKSPSRPLLLLDAEIAKQWNYQKKDISVYQEETLASIDVTRIDDYSEEWQDVHCVAPSDLLLPELKFIDHVADAIPGGLMPESEQTLVFAGEHITPLIPINSILLEYFTSEELVSRMKFKPISGGEPQVEVSLDLSLTGMRGGGAPENYRLTRLYPLKPENALAVIPVLELWPNFQAPDWQAYYALFFDLGRQDLLFHVNFPESVEVETFQDDQGGNYSLTRMETFPSSIECLDETNQVIGLILLQQPYNAVPTETWKVGVDFGSSFTNVYVGHKDQANPLELSNLLFKVTDSPIDVRFPILFNYFVPERFLPVEKPLPLSSVLTTRGSNQPKGEGNRAILDGRIFNPSVRTFNPQASWVETDLKWKSAHSGRLFLRNLILLISANAVRQNTKDISWRISYPSSFSHDERNAYISTWIELLQESGLSTGMVHRCSLDSIDKHFRTESASITQYFADKEKLDMVSSTCIEIGGRGTSDISIWQDNTLLHQCSISFAGQDLLANFLELNPGFIAKRFERERNEWVGLRGGGFHAKLDALLRWESDEWLKKKRPTLTDEPDMEGLIRLMALGVGGLYYYVGLLIKVLKAKGAYTRDYATPVYLGGNGSRLLHWLDVTGRFDTHSEVNSFLNRMLSRGADIEDTEEETRLSSQPKDEVACGLVLDTTKLEGLSRHSADELIPGEAYLVNGTPHSWDQPMDITDDIESFDVPNLDNLNTFLYEFHQALTELQIEGIQPLPSYTLSPEFSANTKLWQGTRRKLDKILQEGEMTGNPKRVRMQPPFILGLKALLDYLGGQWANEQR